MGVGDKVKKFYQERQQKEEEAINKATGGSAGVPSMPSVKPRHPADVHGRAWNRTNAVLGTGDVPLIQENADQKRQRQALEFKKTLNLPKEKVIDSVTMPYKK